MSPRSGIVRGLHREQVSIVLLIGGLGTHAHENMSGDVLRVTVFRQRAQCGDEGMIMSIKVTSIRP